MDLDAVVAQLKANVSMLGGRVAGAAAFAKSFAGSLAGWGPSRAAQLRLTHRMSGSTARDGPRLAASSSPETGARV